MINNNNGADLVCHLASRLVSGKGEIVVAAAARVTKRSRLPFTENKSTIEMGRLLSGRECIVTTRCRRSANGCTSLARRGLRRLERLYSMVLIRTSKTGRRPMGIPRG